MAILINRMKMPPDCIVCPFGWNGCNNQHDFVYMGERPKDCPLVYIQPHGRLIDESWLKETMITTLEAIRANPRMDIQEMHVIAAFDTLREIVEDAPTIIEAEVDDDNGK